LIWLNGSSICCMNRVYYTCEVVRI
jgi:hypothetical protein